MEWSLGIRKKTTSAKEKIINMIELTKRNHPPISPTSSVSVDDEYELKNSLRGYFLEVELQRARAIEDVRRLLQRL